jgi:hypothetical protein
MCDLGKAERLGFFRVFLGPVLDRRIALERSADDNHDHGARQHVTAEYRGCGAARPV